MNNDLKPLLAVLNNAQSANLTAKKAHNIQTNKGHQITGFVLCHPETGERCIVDMATCKWFSKKDFYNMMHDTKMIECFDTWLEMLLTNEYQAVGDLIVRSDYDFVQFFDYYIENHNPKREQIILFIRNIIPIVETY